MGGQGLVSQLIIAVDRSSLVVGVCLYLAFSMLSSTPPGISNPPVLTGKNVSDHHQMPLEIKIVPG